MGNLHVIHKRNSLATGKRMEYMEFTKRMKVMEIHTVYDKWESERVT